MMRFLLNFILPPIIRHIRCIAVVTIVSTGVIIASVLLIVDIDVAFEILVYIPVAAGFAMVTAKEVGRPSEG
jgi:hypothetical protein